MSPTTRKKPARKRARRPGTTARVFWTGRSQAVRLPKEFRFETSEVTIRREGESIILEPFEIERDEQGWPLAFWELAGAAPDFDTGERDVRHERGDVLSSRR